MKIQTAISLALCFLVCGQSATAATVNFELSGTTQATVGGTFHSSLDFTVNFSIDDSAIDTMAFDPNRGAFDGGTALMSISSLAINDAVSTNVTGLFLEDFGNEKFRLVDPTNFYGSAGIAGSWSSGGAIADVNVVSPLIDPTPAVTNREAGLTWEFVSAPDITFHSVSSLTVSNAPSSVPEPSPALFCLLGVSVLAMNRRATRRSVRKVS